MAVILNQDEEENKKELGEPTAAQPLQASTAPVAASAPQAQSASTGPAAPKATSSGRFVNLQSYLDANKDSTDVTGQLQNKLTTQAIDPGKQQIQSGVNDFNTGLEQNKVKALAVNEQAPTPRVARDAATEKALYYQNGGTGAKTSQDMINFNTQYEAKNAPKSSNLADYQQLVGAKNSQEAAAAIGNLKAGQNAAYSGPREIVGNAKINQYQNQLNEAATASGNEKGRFGLLQNYFNTPQYTAGQQKLDNVLLQLDQNKLGRLQDVTSKAAADLKSQQDAAALDASNKVTEQDNIAKTTKEAVSTALKEAQDNIKKQLMDDATKFNKDYLANEGNIKNQGQQSIEQLAKMLSGGGTPDQRTLDLLKNSPKLQEKLAKYTTAGQRADLNNPFGVDKDQDAIYNQILQMQDPNSALQLDKFKTSMGGLDNDALMQELTGDSEVYGRDTATQNKLIQEAGTERDKLKGEYDQTVSQRDGIQQKINTYNQWSQANAGKLVRDAMGNWKPVPMPPEIAAIGKEMNDLDLARQGKTLGQQVSHINSKLPWNEQTRAGLDTHIQNQEDVKWKRLMEMFG